MADSTRQRPRRLALLGAPGSGKGTQAAALQRHFGVPIVATGELLRGQARSGQLGQDTADRLDKGELVPDDAALAAVNSFLDAADTSRGYVLDGFPRTVGQARHPDTPPIDLAVHLAVPDDVARARLAQRLKAGRSDDADRAAVERRLRRYHAETEPLLDLFSRQGILTSIDATQSPEHVTEAILRALADRERAEPSP